MLSGRCPPVVRPGWCALLTVHCAHASPFQGVDCRRKPLGLQLRHNARQLRHVVVVDQQQVCRDGVAAKDCRELEFMPRQAVFLQPLDKARPKPRCAVASS